MTFLRMNRAVFLLLSCAGMLALAVEAQAQPPVFGVDQLENRVPEQPQSPGAPEAEAEAPEGPEAKAEAAFADLDLTQRISQLMLVTLEGLHSPAVSDLGFMDAYTPGGVVIRRIVKPSHATSYISKLKGIELKTGLPIFIGGNIYALTRRDRSAPSAFVQFPTLLSLAATQSEEQALALGGLLARHMAVMGFNLHLGPDFSLAPDLLDAPGSIDSLGSDPELAGRLGAVLMQAYRSQKVSPVAMGFPGGGGNRVNNSPAVLLTPRSQLAARELLPYRRAIADGAEMIHVGTPLVPTLEPGPTPACLSRVVMTEILREELGFEGVILAGPLDSYDVTANYDSADAAILALQHGADMLYWQRSPAQVMRCIERIKRAVEEGRLDEGLINGAVYRVLAMKHRLATESPVVLAEAALAKFNDEKSLVEAAYRVERQGITLVQNRDQVLPLSKERSMPLGITGTIYLDDLHTTLEKSFKPISQQRITTAGHLGEIQAFEIERLTSRIRGMRTVVCVFSDALRPAGQTALIRALRGKGIRVVAVLLGYPRHLDAVADADAILLAYCDDATYAQTLRAIGETLVGAGPIAIASLPGAITMRPGEAQTYRAVELLRVPPGRLPVAHSEAYPQGFSLTYDPRNSFKKVEWDFGNGKRTKKDNVEYAYPSAGRYPLTLTVTGLQGEVASRVFDVTVVNAPREE